MPFTDPAALKAYQIRWKKERKDAWFSANGPCKRCGSRKDLELDHLNPAKKVSHRVWSWSKARREVELAKCQVLCGRCHKAKTAAERREKLDHGTRGMYGAGCRCEQCRKANANYMQTWRHRSGD
jgi:5-methylcytosine-specific restriction endonuclease McrA